MSKWFALTNATQDGPSSGIPQNLDDQVMYSNPSVKEVDCVLIESAMESVDSDLDNSVLDEHV